MTLDLVAKASVSVNASPEKVWEALTTPSIIKKYMFGTDLITDWQVGSKIVWRGEWNGKPYEDKGKILVFEENKVLEYSHFSLLSGVADVLENYHTVRIRIEGERSGTKVTLTQDNNASEEERKHSQENWLLMLQNLKKVVEE